MEQYAIEDLHLRISVLQERLVSFYAIYADIDCAEAKEVIQTQIDNYRSALEQAQRELLAKEAQV